MPNKPLTGKNIAIMIANGFDEVEFVEPQKQLLATGATVKAVSRANGLVNGWYDGSWGHFFPVDVFDDNFTLYDLSVKYLLNPYFGYTGVKRLYIHTSYFNFGSGFLYLGF